MPRCYLRSFGLGTKGSTARMRFSSITVNILWHGDEGRGVRKGTTAVCTLETPFGLDTFNADIYNSCSCCPSPTSEPHRRQNVNLKYHSFLTKFLLFAVPKKFYKNNTVIQGLCSIISKELRSLFFEGIYVNKRVWHFAAVGCKGDLAWFCKLGELQRCYTRLSTVVDKMCCHECLAGAPQYPFEDNSRLPSWSGTLYAERPWDRPPTTDIHRVPYDKAAPERILKRDIFHNAKVGVFQDFVAGAMLLIAEFGYFNSGANGNSRARVLERMHGHFKLFCSTTGKSPNLMGFSKNFLNVPSRKHYGWAKCKGADAVILLEWLVHVAAGCLMDLNDPAHAATLRGIHAGENWTTMYLFYSCSVLLCSA